jgi:NhaA family Na+:H+ antiporter
MTDQQVAEPLPVGRPLPRPVGRFLATEASGGILLMVAAMMALLWANLAEASYERFWHTDVILRIGTFGFEEDLRHFVNDGLMAIFFLVVGLEIKRELVTGDLRDRRTAALPVIAAIGGMVLPAGIYAAINAGDLGADGWGIPMATDIAFALGVLALLGSRVPSTLKLFLLTLAIVDDIGAIVVIAIFYSGDIDPAALAIAAGAATVSVLLRALRIHWAAVHVALGITCWLATFDSGVHATIAGVVFGLLMPARPLAPAAVVRRWSDDISDEPSPAELRELMGVARESVSPAERIQHLLHPLSSFVIVPIFALANAGVVIEADAFDAPGAGAVAAGVVGGLVLGKLVGIVGASWIAVRSRVATLPPEVGWGHLAGAAGLAGIGFTVALFVTNLAFDDPALQASAKLAVLIASGLASVVGVAALLQQTRSRPVGGS